MKTTLNRIATVEVLDLADAVAEPCLAPCEIDPAIVVFPDDGRRYIDIDDGFHRAAALVRWARREGLDLSAVEIDVVVRSED